jgi:hypothetical protein
LLEGIIKYIEEFIEYAPIYTKKTKDVNMQLVALANTRIPTDYAQKSPRSLVSTFGHGVKRP